MLLRALLGALAAWDSGTAIGRAGPDAAAKYWRPVTAAYLDLLRGDTARALDLSVRTITREWTFARTRLYVLLS